MLKQQLSPSFG